MISAIFTLCSFRNEGRAPLRKRWVVFDGEDLIYYENETKVN